MIYIIWLLLDLNFRSAIATKVNFIFYEVLKRFMKVQLFQSISKYHFLFTVPFFYDGQ